MVICLNQKRHILIIVCIRYSGITLNSQICNFLSVFCINAALYNIKRTLFCRSGVRVTVAKEAVNQYMEALEEDIFASDFYELYMDSLISQS